MLFSICLVLFVLLVIFEGKLQGLIGGDWTEKVGFAFIVGMLISVVAFAWKHML